MPKVSVNVYDLEPQVNEFLHPLGLGLYHSGVDVDGREYTYANGHGIVDMPPKVTPHYRGTIPLGDTDRSVSDAIESLRGRFTPTGYDLTSNNCNHFAEAFAFALTQRHIPTFLNRMAAFGSCVACMMPRHQRLEESFNPFQGQGNVLSSREGQNGDAEERRAKIRAATLQRLER